MNIEELNPWLPNRSRRLGIITNTVVVHATAGSLISGAVAALRSRGLSYHYIVGQDGSILKCVPVKREAFHAGVSVGPQGPSVNRYSIGIALVNLNNGKDPYEAEQLAALEWLLPKLRTSMDEYRFLTTHAAISYPRKTDPYKLDLRGVAARVGLTFWQGKQPW